MLTAPGYAQDEFEDASPRIPEYLDRFIAYGQENIYVRISAGAPGADARLVESNVESASCEG